MSAIHEFPYTAASALQHEQMCERIDRLRAGRDVLYDLGKADNETILRLEAENAQLRAANESLLVRIGQAWLDGVNARDAVKQPKVDL